MKRIYRILDADGVAVCDRATKKACLDLLEKHVTEPPTYPGWSNAPYVILRVETTFVRRFHARRRLAKAKTGGGK